MTRTKPMTGAVTSGGGHRRPLLGAECSSWWCRSPHGNTFYVDGYAQGVSAYWVLLRICRICDRMPAEAKTWGSHAKILGHT